MKYLGFIFVFIFSLNAFASVKKFSCSVSTSTLNETVLDQFEPRKDKDGNLNFDGGYVYLIGEKGLILKSTYSKQGLLDKGFASDKLFEDIYQRVQARNLNITEDLAMIVLRIETDRSHMSRLYLTTAVVNISKESKGEAFSTLEEELIYPFSGELSFYDYALKMTLDCKND